MGVGLAVLRFLSAEFSVGNWHRVSGIARSGLKLTLGGVAVASAGAFLLAPLLARSVFGEPALTMPLRIMALAGPPLVVLQMHATMLKGTGRVAQGTFFETLFVGAIMMLMLLGFLAAARWTLTPAAANTMYAASVTLAGAASVLVWRNAVPQIRHLEGSRETLSLVHTGLPLFGVTALNFIINSTDIVMLGFFSGPRTVGLYNACLLVTGFVPFILFSVNQTIPPRFAALHHRGQRHLLASLAKDVTAVTTVATAPVVLALVVLRVPILGLFGPAFPAASTAMLILIAGQTVNVMTGPVGFLLMMTGHERVVRNSTWMAALINVVLNTVLIPHYGLVGAASATMISTATLHGTMAFAAYRRLGILMPFVPGRQLLSRSGDG